MLLTKARYDEIDTSVVDMFEECGLFTIPVDCFALARKLCYRLVRYADLDPARYATAFRRSSDGYSELVYNSQSGMWEYIIFFNEQKPHCRIRWTIFHEIGHIYLGHHYDPTKSYDEKESEANHFAKSAIAPFPLINDYHCGSWESISETFDVSPEASGYISISYYNWLNNGPIYYRSYEQRLLQLFRAA